jgi:hypothetical protein
MSTARHIPNKMCMQVATEIGCASWNSRQKCNLSKFLRVPAQKNSTETGHQHSQEIPRATSNCYLFLCTKSFDQHRITSSRNRAEENRSSKIATRTVMLLHSHNRTLRTEHSKKRTNLLQIEAQNSASSGSV